MGEKPMPVGDEVERALASMRAGFLSGSDRIAAGFAILQEHLTHAPVEEREAVRAAVADIVKAQARLNARIQNLPPSALERFTAMVSVLKAQQAVVDRLGELVK